MTAGLHPYVASPGSRSGACRRCGGGPEAEAHAPTGPPAAPAVPAGTLLTLPRLVVRVVRDYYGGPVHCEVVGCREMTPHGLCLVAEPPLLVASVAVCDAHLRELAGAVA